MERAHSKRAATPTVAANRRRARPRTRKKSCSAMSSTTASQPPIHPPALSPSARSLRPRSPQNAIDARPPVAHLTGKAGDGDGQETRRPEKALDEELEEGLKGTFPASRSSFPTQPVHHQPPAKK